MEITKSKINDFHNEFKEYCQGRSCSDCSVSSGGNGMSSCFANFLENKIIDEDIQEVHTVIEDTKEGLKGNSLFQQVPVWEFNCSLEDIVGQPIKILDSDYLDDEGFYVPYIYGIIQDFGTEYMTIQFDGCAEKFHVLKLMKLKPEVLDLEGDMGELM